MLFFCRVTEFNYNFIQKNNSSPKGTDFKKKRIGLCYSCSQNMLCLFSNPAGSNGLNNNVETIMLVQEKLDIGRKLDREMDVVLSLINY